MKTLRCLILASLLTLAGGGTKAQSVTVELNHRPVGELFEAIERLSP